jgi:predicted Zn-dependent protease with MMP-like domain
MVQRPAFVAPTLDDLALMGERALATIPEPLREAMGPVMLRVDEFPSAEIEQAMELESPFDILGLYQGVDLLHKSSDAMPQDVDWIFLYRRPILDYWCETGEDLYFIVRHVLIHEIGHHFGFSDEDMETIEAMAETEDRFNA